MKSNKVAIPNWVAYVALGLAVVLVAFFGWRTMSASDRAGADLEQQYMRQPRLIDSNGKPIPPSASARDGG